MSIATSLLPRVRRPRFRVARRSPWWAWAAAPGVFVAIGLSPLLGLNRLVALALAVGVIGVLSRHPGPTLVALTWFLPLQIPLSSFLYQHGVPGDLLRQTGAIKEVLGVAILVSAARMVITRRTRLDRIDWLVLAFVGALVLYLVLPMVLSESTYPRSLGDRLLGFRVNAGFLLLFVSVRHAPIDERWRNRFVASVLGAGGLLAAIGVYQFLAPDAFIDFLFEDLGLPYYQLDVLGTPITQLVDVYRWTIQDPVRVGSLFVGPFNFADYMILPAALLLARMVIGRLRPRDMVLLGIVGGALLASQTRANILAIILMALVALAPVRASGAGTTVRRVVANRLRLVAIVAIAAVAFVPSMSATRLGGADESGESTQGHIDEIRGGIELLTNYPLGFGLGTAPALAARLENAPLVISDNSILQVGNELGVVMMILFVVVLVSVFRRLGRAAREHAGDALVSGARLAFIGILAAGMLHHVFQTFAISWPLWAALGFALARPRTDAPVSE